MLPTKFITPASPALHCPTCENLFTDPVISTRCGHTFCRMCITENISSRGNVSNSVCPVDNIPFHRADLVSNIALKGQIDDLEIHCQHGLDRVDSDDEFHLDEEGCPQAIKLGKRVEHEEKCPYALVPCPNSANHCGKFRRRDLDGHLETCPRYPCKYRNEGCEFCGTEKDVKEHMETCVNKISVEEQDRLPPPNNNDRFSTGVENVVVQLVQRVSWLEQNQVSMAEQLQRCTDAISSLETTVDRLSHQFERIVGSQLSRPVRHAVSTSSIVEGNSLDIDVTKKQRSPVSPRIRSTTEVFALPSVPSATPSSEIWRMPFMFKCLGTLRGHQEPIFAMTCRGGKLYSTGRDMLIKVWDTEDVTRGCIATIKGHTEVIHAICSTRTMLYTTGADKSLCSWNMNSLSEQKRIADAHDDVICALVCTGKYLFTSSQSCIKVWETKTLKFVHAMEVALNHWVRALAVDYSKEKVYSGSHNAIHVWDATGSFQLDAEIAHAYGSVYSLAVTKKYVIVGTYNRNTHIFEIPSYQHVKSLTGHIGAVTVVTASPAGRYLFTASSDSTAMIWDLENMLPIQVLTRHEAGVNCLAVYGNLVFTGSEDKDIKVYKYFKLFTATAD
ncbi:E3 ubiquitin- ligase TRAF7-like [Paramuricea clavata]|uniref:E3 ubiquitin- ligase TRAF7-like n=1 Tax=Paramuricea clavata TaxID=317549 RepID=A0A6S7FZ68_PARCT|nr:E3 ubiquitin- ligase TRAF7-like [Paramuricea clavata]